MPVSNSQDCSAKKAIGVFDAGQGGLAVVKYRMTLLPAENMLYLGDTARQLGPPTKRKGAQQHA